MILQSHSQSQKQAQRPITTAHLAQTMTLMSLTAVELRQKIEGALAENPALELIKERFCPTCKRPLSDSGPCPTCSQPTDITIDQPIVFVSPREDFYPGSRKSSGNNEQEISFEELSPDTYDLPEYVMRQIAPELAPDDRYLAAHLITSIDDDGFIRIPLVEIAQYHHVTVSRIEEIVDLIKHSDPVGVGAQSPQEALLVQLETLSESVDIPEKAADAVRDGFDFLVRYQYKELASLLNISTSEAEEVTRFISENLNPYPARAHWGDSYQPAETHQDVFSKPDVIISRLNDKPDSPLVVEVISPMAGRLRVNNKFKKALEKAPTNKADQWQSDLDKASLLVKCLQQRNVTIVRLMELLSRIQRDFILNGDAQLLPITRASLSEKLDVHESTVSRAVSKKTVQLPSGRIVPLSLMFDRSLPVRTELKNIIDNETKPHTDVQLAELLKESGFSVARRTVAKYRSMEGILSARMRSHTHNLNKASPLV